MKHFILILILLYTPLFAIIQENPVPSDPEENQQANRLQLPIDQETYSRYRFTVSSFTNPKQFVEKILNQEDSVSQTFYTKLLPKTRNLLEDYEEGSNPEFILLRYLVSDLNYWIIHELIYNETTFKDVPLSKEIKSFVQSNLTKEERTWINHILIEDAYPEEIKVTAVRYFPGSPLSTDIIISENTQTPEEYQEFQRYLREGNTNYQLSEEEKEESRQLALPYSRQRVTLSEDNDFWTIWIPLIILSLLGFYIYYKKKYK